MKPLIHAKLSVKRYGGDVEDYLPIHNFMDSSKATLPDMRHRALLHNSFGIYIVEQMFGTYITNSEDKDISTRDICEDHCMEDLGFIPTVEKCLETLDNENATWLWGLPRSVRKIELVD